MPFLADGSGGGAGTVAPVAMQVEPGQILALKARYEAVRDMVQDFLHGSREDLRGRALADDDVSKDAADAFRRNAGMALDVTVRFLDELNLNIDQLDQAAKTYRSVEDRNTTDLQQNRGI
ncbi:PE domain-containing protein [Saccharothrix algeriensis]|uniref:PE domain-containing protein n=1 Tax=Saccharothrix algeriensis TaxID=173560 RepID=A0A8T8I247_9PSEU|nr:PE domain-containing protein [Saccharothrix algeriensis]MBM7810624.1 hypothetical protein [Saccharothrix algeriensis]QTR04711.1 PE domain-containing protein [Saccharothrix algeriensis]